MLRELIEESRQRSRKVSTRWGWLWALLILCAVMAVVLASLLGRPPSQALVQEGADAGEHTPPRSQTARTGVPEAVPDTPDESPFSASDSDALRQAFIAALEDYERDLEPQLSSTDLSAWDAEAAQELQTTREAALSHFARRDFPAALETLGALRQQTEALVQRRDDALEQALEAATGAYEQDDHETAWRHIRKARILNRHSDDILALQQRIARLPELLPLLEAARVARVENRPEKELRALDAVLEKDPERARARQRRDQLAATRRDQNYQTLIRQARAELAEGRLDALRSTLAEARRLAPSRPETQALLAELAIREKRQRVAQALREARQAVSLDDWSLAAQHFAAALRDSPGLAEAEDGTATAKRILALRKSMATALQDPYRMANATVAASVRQTLQKAGPHQEQSPSLRDQSEQLESLLEQMGQEVPVTIRSDGQTDIRVRGVGEVGVTAGRVIRLRPGDYVFEGRRRGYKSALLRVRVPYDRPAPEVTVICDEPI